MNTIIKTVNNRAYQCLSFKDETETTKFLEKNSNYGVLEQDKKTGIIYCALNQDKGHQVQDLNPERRLVCIVQNKPYFSNLNGCSANADYIRFIYSIKNDGSDEQFEMYYYRKDRGESYYAWLRYREKDVPQVYRHLFDMLKPYASGIPDGTRVVLPS